MGGCPPAQKAFSDQLLAFSFRSTARGWRLSA